MNKTALYVTVAVIITALVVGGVVYYLVAPAPEEKKVEVCHWWTAPGEEDALAALQDVFLTENPDVVVLSTAVAGGAGVKMKALMKTRLLAGEAPDSFQLHAGYEMLPYYEAAVLEDIDDLWETEGWKAVFPDVVEAMVMWGGHYYAVPVNIHRVNIVWYNKAIFEANNLTEPTTWDEFITVCGTLQDAGITPIALGDKYKWPATHAFEQIMATEPQVYEDFINGEVTSAQLEPILTKFNQYLGYVNTDHGDLTWDEACGKVYAETCAMTIMGDWAKGYFTAPAKGWTYGLEFGAFKVPGTADKFGLCIDCFEHPKDAPHPTWAKEWLKVVGSKEGQDAFNPIKGSIACRTDADKTKYDVYSQMCIDDLATAAVLFPSIAHGSGSPEEVASPLNDKISEFVTNRDVSASASAIASLIAGVSHPKTWDIV